MQIADLIEKFENEFDEIPKGTIKPDTEFKKVIHWSSINAVVVTTMVEYEFGVLILPEEMNSANTITDLFNCITSKQSV